MASKEGTKETVNQPESAELEGVNPVENSVDTDEAGDHFAAADSEQATTSDGVDEEGGAENQGKRVYIGNLSWAVNSQDLEAFMKESGLQVTRASILLGYDGRSKGCAIVEFATSEDAAQAVLTLNDTELKGRRIFVREDRENKLAHASMERPQGRRVYVGNLAWDVSWQDLKDFMREAGEVVYAEIMTDQYSGRSKGCGVVEFSSEEEAQEAIASLSNTELNGRSIFVREDRETSNKTGSRASSGSRAANPSVYVWGLSPQTSWQTLKDYMRRAGNVDSATIFTNNHDELSSGIVVYQRAQDAARAIRELQGTELHGMLINLREDRTAVGTSAGGGRGSGRGGSGRGRGGRGRGEQTSQGNQLFVSNISSETTWRELKDHFRECGDVRRAEVKINPQGHSKGFGTVSFATKEEAEAAIELLNGSELQGNSLEVRLDQKAY